ncbi:MAG: SpoIIE family protein phosphatase [Coriobacteriales bacterium]|nr:SpoIIE family protein phosphatase [Coriobacteriales bacterium]
MNDLCADIGYKSINHAGEELCGDHVDVAETKDGSTVIVLADGLGSGVQASILSTLTSKIICTMMAEGLSLEECVHTIAATLPVTGKHGVAYSTFTIINIVRNHTAELIQFDNPLVILIRDGEVTDYPMTELHIEDKTIYRSTVRLQEDDVFVAMSDGCPHANTDIAYNNDWKREDIAEFMADMSITGYTAKVLCTMLVDECDKLYGFCPQDDATAVVVRIRKRVPMSILFGPPADRDDCNKMMSLFFSKEGKHIVCGGTTAAIAADYLRKPLNTKTNIDPKSKVPPMSEIEGVDLVTEGVVTMSQVLTYAQDYLEGNESYEEWNYGHDGASRICQLLFEEATDINFFVGRAVNPAHQNPNLPVNFSVKMNIVEKLTESLKTMGKRIRVSYF